LNQQGSEPERKIYPCHIVIVIWKRMKGSRENSGSNQICSTCGAKYGLHRFLSFFCNVCHVQRELTPKTWLDIASWRNENDKSTNTSRDWSTLLVCSYYRCKTTLLRLLRVDFTHRLTDIIVCFSTPDARQKRKEICWNGDRAVRQSVRTVERFANHSRDSYIFIFICGPFKDTVSKSVFFNFETLVTVSNKLESSLKEKFVASFKTPGLYLGGSGTVKHQAQSVSEHTFPGRD
jgi:hypothetical protein